MNTPESRIRAGGGARASPDRAASASAVTAACAADGGWTARPQGCRSMVASVPADAGGAPRPPASPGALPFTLHPSHLIHSNEVSPPACPAAPRAPPAPRGVRQKPTEGTLSAFQEQRPLLPASCPRPRLCIKPTGTHFSSLEGHGWWPRGCLQTAGDGQQGGRESHSPPPPSVQRPSRGRGNRGSRPPVRARAGGARRAPRASRGAFQRRTREWL